MTDETQRTLLTTREVADLFRTDRQGVHRLREEGVIPFTKLGERRYRYPADKIRAVLDARTTPATATVPDPLGRTARRGSAA